MHSHTWIQWWWWWWWKKKPFLVAQSQYTWIFFSALTLHFCELKNTHSTFVNVKFFSCNITNVMYVPRVSWVYAKNKFSHIHSRESETAKFRRWKKLLFSFAYFCQLNIACEIEILCKILCKWTVLCVLLFAAAEGEFIHHKLQVNCHSRAVLLVWNFSDDDHEKRQAFYDFK